ncbi:hypothetical protein DW761_13745 [Absiella sp. AM29-15]|nr:hypothetical protein DW761_13745 [Absiella sp. AM29-15]
MFHEVYKATTKEIIESGVTPFMPYTRPKGKKNNEENTTKYGEKDFEYEAADVFHGPQGCIFTLRGIDRKTGYITYRSEKKKCDTCQTRGKCLSITVTTKIVVKHIWQESLDEAERIRLMEYWQRYYPQRSRTIERVFADAKERHGMRFTRYKGIKKVLMRQD